MTRVRVVATAIAFVAALVVTATVAFFSVLYLAGPHGGALPASLGPATLAVGWLFVALVPAFVARWTWRRSGVRR